MNTLRIIVILSFVVTLFVENSEQRKKASVKHIKKLLKQLSKRHAVLSRKRNLAEYNYGINITEYNQQILFKESEKCQKYEKYVWSLLNNYNAKDYSDETIRRQIERYSFLGVSAIGDRAIDFTKLVKSMETVYGSAKVCVKEKCGLYLDPDLTHIMATNRDYDTLLEAWVNWRDATGKQIRDMYSQYVEFTGEIAKKNSNPERVFNDYSDCLLYGYEDKHIKQEFESVWKEIEPFYKQLHTFVRLKLKKIYGKQMPNDGTIPAHLLGNMWAQKWDNLQGIVTPFTDAPLFDVTQAMIDNNYNRTYIFKLAEQFFVGIGLNAMPDTFWTKSMLQKPTDREVMCHPTSWDFCDGKDYRIRQCTEPTMEHLITAHHEMGHTEYYMAYKDQPFILRDGANPGFHEAIGDTIALSVSTPKYLQSIGLMNDDESSKEALINYQLSMALQKIAFLPFAYIVDLWRWDVYSGKITVDNYNKKWWEYRMKYQGVSPPIKRSEQDFDPGAKYHVPADISYISYFVAVFLQFQFHEALCKVAKEPVLYQCSIAGNKEAGGKLKKMLSYGASIPWPRQLKQITGSEKLSAKPILKYFEPLRIYLKKALKNEKIGWNVNVGHDSERETEEHDSNSLENEKVKIITQRIAPDVEDTPSNHDFIMPEIIEN